MPPRTWRSILSDLAAGLAINMLPRTRGSTRGVDGRRGTRPSPTCGRPLSSPTKLLAQALVPAHQGRPSARSAALGTIHRNEKNSLPARGGMPPPQDRNGFTSQRVSPTIESGAATTNLAGDILPIEADDDDVHITQTQRTSPHAYSHRPTSVLPHPRWSIPELGAGAGVVALLPRPTGVDPCPRTTYWRCIDASPARGSTSLAPAGAIIKPVCSRRRVYRPWPCSRT